MRFQIAIVSIALFLTGCASSSVVDSRAMADWTRQQGGEIADGRLERLSRVGDLLTRQAGCATLHFHVLNAESLSAYSWPTGDVFVTAGLMAQATDDELAAGIAHELGHLLGDGHMHSAVSLRGVDSDSNVEKRADAIGCRILEATGRSPQALAGVLVKVCAASAPENRRELEERIALIQERYAAP